MCIISRANQNVSPTGASGGDANPTQKTKAFRYFDWYRPPKLTCGLTVQYLYALIEWRVFSATNPKYTDSHDVQQTFDKAA